MNWEGIVQKNPKIIKIKIFLIPSSIPSDTEEPEDIKSNEETKERALQIPKDISKIRKELAENYNLFTTARDSLSKFSFTKVQENFKKESNLSSSALDKLINSKNMSDDEIHENIFTMPNMKIGSIPELSSFFDVISNLKIGMSKMEETDKMMRNLGEVVVEANFMAEENTIAIKEVLSLLDQEVVQLITNKIENEEKI